MLRLIIFDVSRLLRPRPKALERAWLRGLKRLPRAERRDAALDDGVLRVGACELALNEVEDRRVRDSVALLGILSALAMARGFGAVTWKVPR